MYVHMYVHTYECVDTERLSSYKMMDVFVCRHIYGHNARVLVIIINKQLFQMKVRYRVSVPIGTSMKNATYEKMHRTFKSTSVFDLPA